MTEARQQNTEVRLAIGKVADKMDQLAAKVTRCLDCSVLRENCASGWIRLASIRCSVVFPGPPSWKQSTQGMDLRPQSHTPVHRFKARHTPSTFPGNGETTLQNKNCSFLFRCCCCCYLPLFLQQHLAYAPAVNMTLLIPVPASKRGGCSPFAEDQASCSLEVASSLQQLQRGSRSLLGLLPGVNCSSPCGRVVKAYQHCYCPLQVDEFQKQNTSHAILPGISSVTMETSMIMSNIQRIIQVRKAS